MLSTAARVKVTLLWVIFFIDWLTGWLKISKPVVLRRKGKLKQS